MFRPHTPARLAVALLCATVAAAAACRELAFEPEDPRSTTYAIPGLVIDLSQFQSTTSGVYYRDLALGSGTPVRDSSIVNVTYRGFLTTGQVFDSSGTQARALNLQQAVPGFRAGLVGARQGSRRVLVIPPSQGYGNRTSGRIPAGSVLVFDLNIAGVTNPAATTTTSRTAP